VIVKLFANREDVAALPSKFPTRLPTKELAVITFPKKEPCESRITIELGEAKEVLDSRRSIYFWPPITLAVPKSLPMNNFLDTSE
jgi:hypothetical protein